MKFRYHRSVTSSSITDCTLVSYCVWVLCTAHLAPHGNNSNYVGGLQQFSNSRQCIYIVSCSLDEYSDLPDEERSTVLLLGVTRIPTSPVATRRLLPAVITAPSAASAVDKRGTKQQQRHLHSDLRYHPQHLPNQPVRRNSSAGSRRLVVVRRNSSTKRADGRRILQVSW